MRRTWKICGGGALSAAFLLMTATPAMADFEYPTFGDTGSLSVNGSAAVVRAGPGRVPVLRLTDGGYEQMGSAWVNDKVDVTKSFDTTFEVLLDGRGIGADGIAFVLQASGPRALGGWGGGLGYRGLKRSVAIEFDDYQNGPDPSDNHVGLVVNNNPDHHLATAAAPVPLFGAPFRARVVYDSPARNLRVYLGGPGGEAEPHLILDRAVDLSRYVGSPTAWAGFTGATGNVGSTQDILSWSFSTR
ncbi:L-type lectin-domain containing protein [Actinoplanes oblitus]|uniref:L-type lectin-domain containing protein n=1 Tax=Actinoplanes oblitus TaxID=3040509 RepID=A0ABY8W660_9ACTN|nr:L-type lectin-domain containing protein [Actinoplanes oblitus]WIM93326.1 L-type lectin-domain containing protein [Actinoplanes oblitus]